MNMFTSLRRSKLAYRCLLIGISCIFFMVSAHANEADSLKRLLAKNPADSVKVNLLNALSKSYFNDNPDTAIIIATSSKVLAEKIGFRPGLALALKNIGYVYYMKGTYSDAVKNWQQAQEVYQEIGDKKGVANMLSNQGAVFFNQGDEAKSLELHLQSLRISEEIKDTLRIVTSLNNIGSVYSNKKSTWDQSIEYFMRAYKLSKVLGDQYLIGTATVNLGEMYYKKGDDNNALLYLNQSVKAFEGSENLQYALNDIGRVYNHQQRYDDAIKMHLKAYEISKNLDIRLDMAQSLVWLAQSYFMKGDINAAIHAFNESLNVAIPMNALDEMREAYDGLTKSYSKKSDYKNAFRYQELLLGVKDSIYNTATAKKLGVLQFTFDLEKKQSEIELLNKDKLLQEQEIKRQKTVRNSFMGGFAIVLLFAMVFFAQRNRISKEKKRSEELLLNILPEETAEELKETGTAKTKSFESVSVLFTDFKNFTNASEKLTPEELVAEINYCYSEFDRIVEKYGIEKIKTIGDSYMCAGGLPVPNQTHPVDVVSAGLDMVAFIERNKQERMAKGQPYFELRLGIHTGPLVAGIVGLKKFAYDIWGDTVNTASRMESSGEVGRVNISGSTYELVKERFQCTYRGKVQAKNKGEIDMYFVEGVLANT